MVEELRESIQEHQTNLEVLDQMTNESVRNLYSHLVKEVSRALEEFNINYTEKSEYNVRKVKE